MLLFSLWVFCRPSLSFVSLCFVRATGRTAFLTEVIYLPYRGHKMPVAFPQEDRNLKLEMILIPIYGDSQHPDII